MKQDFAVVNNGIDTRFQTSKAAMEYIKATGGELYVFTNGKQWAKVEVSW